MGQITEEASEPDHSLQGLGARQTGCFFRGLRPSSRASPLSWAQNGDTHWLSFVSFPSWRSFQTKVSSASLRHRTDISCEQQGAYTLQPPTSTGYQELRGDTGAICIVEHGCWPFSGKPWVFFGEGYNTGANTTYSPARAHVACPGART